MMSDDQRQAKNRRRNRRQAAARMMATMPANTDRVKDRQRLAEYAVLTTLSLHRGEDLATTDVGRISGIGRPRRALRRLERLGLVKSVPGWHKDSYQALRGWQLAAKVTP
jgi:hypothetical protein